MVTVYIVTTYIYICVCTYMYIYNAPHTVTTGCKIEYDIVSSLKELSIMLEDIINTKSVSSV